ncbi:MAG TPA: tetratricopeptide repeat protein [Terriglobales bacterium]|jgi:tetratricopeptide (TPR) repeat protein|nr:tetratricopeptide repeat protein [Terriglobales bacterium]
MSRNYCSPRQLHFTVLLCAVAFLPIAFARSDEPHWIRVNSSHFSVVTDADEKHGHDVAVRFEQMRAVFGQLLSRSRINMSEPIDIIALRNDEEYSKIVPIRQGQGIAVGFFIAGEDRDYFTLNLSKDESWRSISRDFALAFLNYNYPPTQPWFDEGFAEYFSSLRLDKQVQIGADPESFTELLNTSKWLTIPDLFRTVRESSSGEEKSRHTLFYAESWIVMHYLLTQNKLSETGAYLDLVENQKLAVEEAIQKAYGMSAAQFEQAVKDHFHSLSQPGDSATGAQLSGVPLPENIGSSTQELPEAEGRALVEEMSLRLPDHREHGVQQLESITNQPKGDNVVARRGLAWAHLEKMEFDRAVDELNKGAELNAKDPWLHYYLALVRLRAAQSSRTSIQGLPNMMQDLHLVLDWDPEFAAARSMLAMAQLDGGGVHAALDSMRPALQLSPRNQSYLLDMAQIYLAGKNWDAATAMLERLKNSPDPKVAKSAQEQLEGLPTLRKYGVLPQSQTSGQSQQMASASSQSATPSVGPPSSAKRPPEPQAQTAKQNPKTDEEVTEDHRDQIPAAPQLDKRAIKFVKGKLIAVDCTQPPSAILTVAAGARVLKLRTQDYKSLTLIGADAFSCDWKTRAVAVNYRAGGATDGDLVSLEVQ